MYSIFVLSYLHTATPITYMYTPGPTTMPTSPFVWGKIILVFFVVQQYTVKEDVDVANRSVTSSHCCVRGRVQEKLEHHYLREG